MTAADTQRDAIRALLRMIADDRRLAPIRDRLVVFGSVAANAEAPGDLDILVDCHDHRGGDRTVMAAAGEAYILLAMARRFYGQLDVFVLVGTDLWVRNDLATEFMPARHARAITAAGRRGRKLKDLLQDPVWEQAGPEAPAPG